MAACSLRELGFVLAALYHGSSILLCLGKLRLPLNAPDIWTIASFVLYFGHCEGQTYVRRWAPLMALLCLTHESGETIYETS